MYKKTEIYDCYLFWVKSFGANQKVGEVANFAGRQKTFSFKINS